MRTLLEYLQQRTNARIVTEAFSLKDMSKALKLMDQYLKKKLEHLYMLPNPDIYELNGTPLTGVRWINVKTGANVRIGWKTNERGSSNAYCVDFFKDAQELFSGSGKTDLTVYTNGASVALVLPLVVEIMSTGKFDANSGLVKKLNAATVEESFKIAGITYTFVKEDADTKAALLKKKKSLQSQKSNKAQMGDTEGVRQIMADIERINDALGSGDDAKMEETLLSFQKGVSTQSSMDPAYQTVQRKIDSEKKNYSNPDTAWKMMNRYLELALKGDRAGVVLCGAPGVGKTFRIKKFLKVIRKPDGEPYTWQDDSEFGVTGDIALIKGKGSAAMLYRYLYRTKEPGKILMIDDADSILTDANAINLLKAAMEAGRDRVVTYAVAGKIKDINDFGEEEELPKSFKYNGKIIIITNMSAGSLDTAIRSRAYLQDLNFNTGDVLKMIKSIMVDGKETDAPQPMIIHPDHVGDETWTQRGREKAFEFLTKLYEEGTDMEISLRSAGTCIGIFSVIAGSKEDEALAEEMVRENMRLQFARGGEHY